ncbi:phosphoadenosine phosphosulfate reductase family protein [Arcicella sp. LKC2W]|uniref:phosphoadenosine phosphosulfate reductase domain-containing protein n=1 Tax=Arcicella sp. LKC2W TaxID=2984198 RepID=UPI002B21D1AC|nr:phosphoadenosine phosphosulfate reductase family protein [Arcicella sp. LKC2W]MEA5459129.1 phosphoadenosine phosphosulfate reductase family protein [Arcicella sp. LKC2W]
MSRKQLSFWDSERVTLDECIELTIRSFQAYANDYKHWCIAWSGGKDSTALLTLTIALIESGQIPKPKSLTVLYADTRMELTPLQYSAFSIINQLKARGIDVRVVTAEMDKRFLVYILGRGVPPPNNNTLRWCTRQIKLDPMQTAIDELYKEFGERLLILTGVRQGESAVRDGRIAMSCGKNGAECGQGWFQKDLSDTVGAKLAPLLHWRVCTVWDWLKIFAPRKEHGCWQTQLLADAYGGDEAEEVNARTGCIGCPLASHDKALETIIQMPQWNYLKPLMHLRIIYNEMRLTKNRLRQPSGKRLKSGILAKNQNRLGPLTIESRIVFLNRILMIQKLINEWAEVSNKPKVDILNEQEVDRIKFLIDNNQMPNGWNGDEPLGTEKFIQVFQDGSSQPLLF